MPRFTRTPKFRRLNPARPGERYWMQEDSDELRRARLAHESYIRMFRDRYPKHPTDGHMGPVRDRSDCVVRAAAAALAIPYSDALAIAELAGRVPGTGTIISDFVLVARRLGFTIGEGVYGYKLLPVPRFRAQAGGFVVSDGTRIPAELTLGRFLKQHPTGRYLVIVDHHALSVVDGVPGDTTGLRTRVRKVYPVTLA